LTPGGYMSKAGRAIASAKLLLDDGDTEGTCNRAYYVMFDTAHAALLWSGATINPAAIKTHSGFIAAFGQYLIKPGHLPVELGKSLNQVQRIRQLADYTGEEVTNEVARQAVEQANSFVEKIRQKLGLIA
jgi:uncharacterized protein (UPF0332 family)